MEFGNVRLEFAGRVGILGLFFVLNSARVSDPQCTPTPKHESRSPTPPPQASCMPNGLSCSLLVRTQYSVVLYYKLIAILKWYYVY